jgi:hypothetical protein
MEKRFRVVWARADIEIPSSCLCQRLTDPAKVSATSNSSSTAAAAR